MWGGGEYELRIINYELRIMGGERTFCVLAGRIKGAVRNSCLRVGA